MGRKKKVKEVKEVIVESYEVPADSYTDTVVPKVEEKEVKEKLSLVAKYKVVDLDGNKEILSFRSEGDSTKELLANLDFTKGINVLVNVEVKRGKKEFQRALAPHKARQILEHKNVQIFDSLFN